MGPDFSAVSGKERIALCLKLAQSALDRANASENKVTKELYTNLAESWRAMARQFASLSSLSTDLRGESAPRSDTRASAQPAAEPEFDASFSSPLKGFAT